MFENVLTLSFREIKKKDKARHTGYLTDQRTVPLSQHNHCSDITMAGIKKNTLLQSTLPRIDHLSVYFIMNQT